MFPGFDSLEQPSFIAIMYPCLLFFISLSTKQKLSAVLEKSEFPCYYYDFSGGAWPIHQFAIFISENWPHTDILLSTNVLPHMKTLGLQFQSNYVNLDNKVHCQTAKYCASITLCLWVWCVYLRISLDLSGSGCSSLLISGQLHCTHLTIRLGEGWNVGKTHIKGKTDFDTILLITFPK